MLPLRMSPQPEWETLPARVRMTWRTPPSLKTILRLVQDSGSSASREDILAEVREARQLRTRSMSVDEVRGWLSRHQGQLEGPDWFVEILTDEGWVEAPGQPESVLRGWSSSL